MLACKNFELGMLLGFLVILILVYISLTQSRLSGMTRRPRMRHQSRTKFIKYIQKRYAAELKEPQPQTLAEAAQLEVNASFRLFQPLPVNLNAEYSIRKLYFWSQCKRPNVTQTDCRWLSEFNHRKRVVDQKCSTLLKSNQTSIDLSKPGFRQEVVSPFEKPENLFVLKLRLFACFRFCLPIF